VEEARAVLERLKRIETLDRTGAPAAAVLAEVRELLREAEAWVDREADGRAVEALEGCRVAHDAGAVPVA
jgi:hypothetical protein